MQAIGVRGESPLSQVLPTRHQVAAVLLARHRHGFPQHVHADVRASSAAALARQVTGFV